MDLTQFMHGTAAEILACSACGTVRRKEAQQADYESDEYDPVLMQYLYPRYRNAFAEKRNHLEQLPAPGAEVLEVGSHLGAFLEVAETWGWRPTGLDIGRETSAFARRQGCTVRQLPLGDYSPHRRPDAVFIWNCFEQLDNPWDTMIQARRLLSRHGLIVLQVPNVDFYRHRHSLKALGYNNLLGFPYLNGYNLEALQSLLVSTGFEIVTARAASLLTPPYPEMNKRLQTEWDRTRVATEHRGAAHAPWIEIVGRSVASMSTE
jgi:Methyltransferase domain